MGGVSAFGIFCGGRAYLRKGQVNRLLFALPLQRRRAESWGGDMKMTLSLLSNCPSLANLKPSPAVSMPAQLLFQVVSHMTRVHVACCVVHCSPLLSSPWCVTPSV